MEYYIAIRINHLKLHAAMWMNRTNNIGIEMVLEDRDVSFWSKGQICLQPIKKIQVPKLKIPLLQYNPLNVQVTRASSCHPCRMSS